MPLKSEHGNVHVCIEAGATHTGYNSAKELIWAVGQATIATPHLRPDSWKFQVHKASDLIGIDYEVAFQSTKGEERISITETLRVREMSRDEWTDVFRIVNSLGSQCFATPGSEDNIDLLKFIGSSAIKISGSDMTHLPLIRYAAESGLPLLLDARCTKDELWIAVDAAEEAGCDDITIVLCPGGYPAPAESLNLGLIPTYAKEFEPYPVGYTDHFPGFGMCIAAVAMGATFIEKTVTMDRNTAGPEHMMSLEPREVSELVALIRNTEKAMGEEAVEITSTQNRRSVFAGKDLEEGEEIVWGGLRFMRPGNIRNGIGVEHAGEIVGKRMAKRVAEGNPVLWKDVSL